jgi:hypothetical protein
MKWSSTFQLPTSPTVILLNKKGEIVFMGELEGAKSMLADLLKD